MCPRHKAGEQKGAQRTEARACAVWKLQERTLMGPSD